MAPPIIAVTLSTQELPRMVHWRRMFEGLHEGAATPLAVNCGTTSFDMAALIAQVDGLLFSGGGDVDRQIYGGDPADPTLSWVNPLRDANEIAAYDAATRRGLPVLAICRGAQLVNAVRGGRLSHRSLTRPSIIGPPSPRRRRAHRHRPRCRTHPTQHHRDLDGHTGTAALDRRQQSTSPGHSRPIARPHCNRTCPDGLIEAYEGNDRQLTGIE
jgi:gamma-glutamyl-gamma-aminobutyrate hydrolase PuuD